jgi:hypothetical protein
MFRSNELAEESLPQHRLTLGAKYPLPGKDWSLSGTTLYERHFGFPLAPDFNRYRQAFEIEHARRSWSPWAYQDFSFQNSGGFVRSRSRLGLHWKGSATVSFRLAYQFESLDTGNAWAPRHAVYTELSINGPFWIKE